MLLSDWHTHQQPIAVQIKLMTPALTTASSLKQVSDGAFLASIRVCFSHLPKQLAYALSVSRCPKKQLEIGCLLHFLWQSAQAAKHLRRIQSHILVGSEPTVPHSALLTIISLECLMHTHIRPSLLAQTQSLYLSTISQHQSTALQCLEPRGGGMRPIERNYSHQAGTFGACIEVMRYEIYPPQRKADMTGGDIQILQTSGMIY